MKAISSAKHLVFAVLICLVMAVYAHPVDDFTPDARKSDDTHTLDAFGEALGVLWEKVYDTSRMDWGNSIKQTEDGGYVITGAYDRDFWSPWPGYFTIIKLDKHGDEEWQYLHGGDVAYDGYDIVELSDGGYVAVGERGYATLSDMFVVNLDAAGNERWNLTIGGALSDTGSGIARLQNDYIVIVGTTSSFSSHGSYDIWLLKMDKNGNILMNKTYGTSYSDIGNDILATSDGYYILAGYTESGNGDKDAIIIKLDSDGNVRWQRVIGEDGYDEIIRSIDPASDGGYILAGCAYNYSAGNADVYVMKVNSNGIKEWCRFFGGDNYDEAYCIKQTHDGGYILVGVTQSFNQDQDIYVIKINGYGEEEWYKLISHQPYNCEDSGRSIVQTRDYCYAIAGSTGSSNNYDIYVVKLDHENLPPEQPNHPIPRDGETDVDIDATLSWCCSDPDNDPLTFDIYLGTENPPPLVETGYRYTEYQYPELFETNTTYYWMVVAHDNHNHETAGPVWKFTTGYPQNTPPYTPSSPYPENGSVDVPLNITLRWKGGDPDPNDSVVYDIMFGTENPPPKIVENYTMTNLSVSPLNRNTTYYWRVISRDDHGAVSAGPLWHFTTIASESDDIPPCVKIIRPGRAVYLFNHEIIRFPVTLVIGYVEIEIKAVDNETGISHVEIYVDSVMKANLSSEPFTWRWSDIMFGIHTIKVIAYDNNRNTAEDSIIVWKFF